MITKDDVHHIAALARLNLTEQEIEQATTQLSSILTYIEQLQAVDTSKIEPTNFVAPEHDPLRDDVVIPSLEQDEILQNGPKVKKNHFAVPKVIG